MAKRWYVVHAYSGYEKKGRDALKERISLAGMDDCFDEILVSHFGAISVVPSLSWVFFVVQGTRVDGIFRIRHDVNFIFIFDPGDVYCVKNRLKLRASAGLLNFF